MLNGYMNCAYSSTVARSLKSLSRKEAAINYGARAFAILNTGARPRRVPGLLTSVAWFSEKDVRYLIEGTVNTPGISAAEARRLALRFRSARRFVASRAGAD